ncbi:hypothetical protein L249_1603 [Ophiocordyceps polyrhachis-furcata BCC 54312]|uniref:Uncharacterized protein n=1 Tax=Ophiocordyceps polyrhachis-furcata BCC 54312 TaxID=1330021 RepID=A0A367KZF2_9HYPO|nr:hypothetical protein L249_1603 [Ophiocordyceps polyrhachis-furcata BCC 54312]
MPIPMDTRWVVCDKDVVVHATLLEKRARLETQECCSREEATPYLLDIDRRLLPMQILIIPRHQAFSSIQFNSIRRPWTGQPDLAGRLAQVPTGARRDTYEYVPVRRDD